MPWIYLALGAFGNLFAGGRWLIPLAAWVAPVFLLQYVQSVPSALSLAHLWLVLAVTGFWAYRGLVPVPPAARAIIMGSIAVGSAVPYALHAVLAPGLPGFGATLIFPAAAAALELAGNRLSPYGSWGSVAYSQYGNRPLMHLASLTGTPGIAFFMAWFASTINWSWASGFDAQTTSPGLLIYACVLGGLLAVAGIAFLRERPASTVMVAAIGWPEGIVTRHDLSSVLDRTLGTGTGISDALRARFVRVHDWLLEETARVAKCGAQIAVWPEASALVFAPDAGALRERVTRTATNHGIHILAGMGIVYPGATRPFENKAVLFSPSDGIVAEYVKAIPVPGPEAQASRPGPRRVAVCDTPHGRIAIAICFDLDFPSYIRQASHADAELLLVPASDWEAIKEAHHVSAAFRAVENGCAMMRCTRWGLSVALDSNGRELAVLDPFRTPNASLLAHVPVARRPTLYGRWGDWFAWMCAVGVLARAIYMLGRA